MILIERPCRLIVVVLVFFVSCHAQSKNDSPVWKEYISREGRFKVTFPGDPKTRNHERDGIGATEQSVSFPQITYMLIWADFPNGRDTQDDDALKANYDFLRDGIMKTVHGKLISEKDVRANDKLGRDAVLSTVNQIVNYRVFVVGRRQYQLIVSRDLALSDDSVSQQRIKQFMESFRLIENDQRPKSQM